MKGVKKIGEILVEKGFLREESVDKVMAAVRPDGVRFGEECLRLGFITEGQLAVALAEQYGFSVVDIENSVVNEEVCNLIPAETLHRFRVMPVVSNGAAYLLTADPTDVIALDNVERMIEERGARPGRVAVAPAGDIERLFNRGTGPVRILKEAATGFDDSGIPESEIDTTLTLEKIAVGDSPVVKLVDTVIYDAIAKRASDIHLETDATGLCVKFRIDGALHKVMEAIDRKHQPSIISRIKVMSELDISERRVPQDGRFRIRFRKKTIDFRVSIMPAVYGEDAVIRILDKEHLTSEFEKLTLSSLGFGEKEVFLLRKMIKEPYGMMLVTGPTGSGKTTSLYAALSEINTGDDKIITIEDPVEYELKGVVQIQVNEKKGLTFAKGLRSILRHDPDKIMVGEIRDPETAQIAIQAALTGHLVFTTVHANNVFDVIGRFIHMGIEPYNFVSSLNCIVAQRLIRIICPSCRRPSEQGQDILKDCGLDPSRYGGVVFYEGAGCEECHRTGYMGRKAIVEVLDLNDEIRDMIATRQSMTQLKKKALEAGMVTLRQVAVERAVRGETTLKEINRVTFVE